MIKIFINIFIEKPSEYVLALEKSLSKIETLEELETFLSYISLKYDTDENGTTTWVNQYVIIRSGYFKQFTIPLSVSVKENRYGNVIDQINCWDGFREICRIIESGEYS